jgi:hypothetical protein
MKGNSKLFSTLKKLFIIVLMLLITFGGYVAIITRNTMHMTIRQRVLKSIYPAFTWWNRLVRTQSKVFVNELPAPLLNRCMTCPLRSTTVNLCPCLLIKGKKYSL